MRKAPNKKIADYRVRIGPLGSADSLGNNGAFEIPTVGDTVLHVIASDQDGWDHVSVSLPDRCPTWTEMDYIRTLFFRGDECVMQLHPPRAKLINDHRHCLHLWRPQTAEIPIPPPNMV